MKYFPPAPRGLEKTAYDLHVESREGEIRYKAPGTTEFVAKKRLDIRVNPEDSVRNTIRILPPKAEGPYVKSIAQSEAPAISRGAAARAGAVSEGLAVEGLVRGAAIGVAAGVITEYIHK